MVDAGYESVGNYLYLKAHGQNCYMKSANYEIRKTKKYRQQIWRMENMQYLEQEDRFVCAAGRKLRPHRIYTTKEYRIIMIRNHYQCEGCAGCHVRELCTKFKAPDFRKEVKVCEEFAQCRAQAHK